MLDARGLVTYVVTYHQHVLMMALLIALLLSPFVLYATKERGVIERLALTLAFFIGLSTVSHFALSAIFGVDAVDVETIRLGSSIDDGGLANKP